MKKLIIVIALLLFAGLASGQVYIFPTPTIVSVELVDGAIEVVYKRVQPGLFNIGGWDSSHYYDVWKNIYKATIEPVYEKHRSGLTATNEMETKIVLWGTRYGTYIPSKTIPESYEFDGGLKLYGDGGSNEGGTIDYWGLPPGRFMKPGE